MFQIYPSNAVVKEKSAPSGSLADRLLAKKSRYTDSQKELPRTKSAGDIFTMDWRPLPLFYSSNQS